MRNVNLSNLSENARVVAEYYIKNKNLKNVVLISTQYSFADPDIFLALSNVVSIFDELKKNGNIIGYNVFEEEGKRTITFEY